MMAWDQYLHAELKTYSADDEYLTDLLAFVTYPHLFWDWIHVWPLLGLSYNDSLEREDADRKALHLTGLKQPFDAYRHMLSQFLTNQERAGRHWVTHHVYARVAFRMTKYLFEPKRP